MKTLEIVILFPFLLYPQTSHNIDTIAAAKPISSDTSFNKRVDVIYQGSHGYFIPYNQSDLDKEKNTAVDLFTNYGDNILAMVAGYFQGKGEAYRVTIEYGGPLAQVYSQGELSNRWHSYSVYKTSFQIGTVFTIFLSGYNDFWRGAIQSATCLSLNNLISDGVYNNAKGFNWWRQSGDTGWGLEKALTPAVKLGILSALIAIRIIYELWLRPE